MPARALLVLALSSSLMACSNSAAQPPAQAEAAGQQAEAEADDAPEVTTPKAASAGGGCSAADLSLDPSTVVGTVDGKTISASDFGDDAIAAEKEARREYCNQLDRIRSSALQRAIDDRLLTGAAERTGKTVDAYVRDRLSALTSEPTDAEVAAFYEARKKADAPALELVADQVKSSMMEERSQQAFSELVADLERNAEIERSLPDIRPAAEPVQIPAHAATFGPDDATIEVVEFSDFECPYCARAAAGVSEIKAKYGDQVRFAYRHFPLSFHPHAKDAATYAQCARRQEKFWPMHDGIFALEAIDDAGLRRVATDIGLDMGTLETCLDSDEVADEIAADMREASAVGVAGTPTIFINGRLFNGSPTGEGLSRAIEEELARAKG